MSNTYSKLADLANEINKEVQELAQDGEVWTVSDNPKISITMQDPRGGGGGGRGQVITPENCSDLKAVMDSIRARYQQEATELEQYVKDMTEKCGR